MDDALLAEGDITGSATAALALNNLTAAADSAVDCVIEYYSVNAAGGDPQDGDEPVEPTATGIYKVVITNAGNENYEAAATVSLWVEVS